MPDSAERLNYHFGLYLEEKEFKLEQDYHSLLRRRLNYALFSPGILRGLELVYDTRKATVTVKKGVAVDKDDNTGLGRELIVATDCPVSVSGLSGKVYIVLSFGERNGAAKPTSSTQPATIIEEANIGAVSEGNFTPDPNTKIVLGSINIGTELTANPTRQMAQVRTDLLPVVVTPPGITVFPLSVESNATAVLTLTATGSFNFSGINARSVEISGSDVDNIKIILNTGVQMQITFDIATFADMGSRTVTVTNNGVSATATFHVVKGMTLTGFEPVNVPEGREYITFVGTKFSSPAFIEFSKEEGASPPVFFPPILVSELNVSEKQISIHMNSIPLETVKGKVRVTCSGGSLTSSFDFVPPPYFPTAGTLTPNPFHLSTDTILEITGKRFYTPMNVRFAPYNDSVSRLAGTSPDSFPSEDKGESVIETKIKVEVPGEPQSDATVIIETPGGIVETPDTPEKEILKILS